MDDENVRGDSSTGAVPEECPVEQLSEEAEGSVDEPSPRSDTAAAAGVDPDPEGVFWRDTEYLPFTPGDQLPEESDEDPPGEFYPPSVFGTTRRESPGARSEPNRVGSSGSSEAAAEDGPRELDEIREILLGREPLESGLSGLEERIDGVRREVLEQILAVEGRLREDLDACVSEGLAKVRDPRDLGTALDEILNLVAVSQETQRKALESHTRETKAALDDLLSLVRELARTMVIMIGGEGGGEQGAEPAEPVGPPHDAAVQGMDATAQGDTPAEPAEPAGTPTDDAAEGADATAQETAPAEQAAEPAETPPDDAARRMDAPAYGDAPDGSESEGEGSETTSQVLEVDQVAVEAHPQDAPDGEAPVVEEKREVGILNLRMTSRGRARG